MLLPSHRRHADILGRWEAAFFSLISADGTAPSGMNANTIYQAKASSASVMGSVFARDECGARRYRRQI